MTTDIKTLSAEDLVELLLKLRGEEVFEGYFGSVNCASQLAVAVAEVRAELLARLSEKEEALK